MLIYCKFNNLRSCREGNFRLNDWHTRMGDPTLADAICDRLLHNSYKLELKGESIRKTRQKKGEPQM